MLSGILTLSAWNDQGDETRPQTHRGQSVLKRALLPHMAAIFSNVRAGFIHETQSYETITSFSWLLFQLSVTFSVLWSIPRFVFKTIVPKQIIKLFSNARWQLAYQQLISSPLFLSSMANRIRSKAHRLNEYTNFHIYSQSVKDSFSQ